MVNRKSEIAYVAISSGTGFGAPVSWSTGAFAGTRANLLGDVNGDGKADLVAWNDTSMLVRLSSGAGFGPALQWSSGSFYGTRGNFVGAVDSD